MVVVTREGVVVGVGADSGVVVGCCVAHQVLECRLGLKYHQQFGIDETDRCPGDPAGE